MRRRRMLGCCAALAGGLFASLDSRAALPALGEGWRHPCRGALPESLLKHDLVAAAFEGLEPAALWDTHAHLLGTGDSGSGCSVHPSMQQWWQPMELLRRHTILNAACVDGNVPSIDKAYVERLAAQAREFPRGARWLLFAFERAHDDAGRPRDDWSTFHVPDAYAAQVARTHADRFEWVASVHPYRPDAIERLDAAVAAGTRAMKWLPSAMNIDLRDPRCRSFYERLVRCDMPLIVHSGEEHAVPGARRDELGNPLLMRHALDAGVRVVAAHCSSLGRSADTDKPSAPPIAAFELFARLMDEPAWQDRLLGDVSALFQVNRSPRIWRTVLQRDDWHERLLHGSDHPLPGVMPLFSPARMASAGLLDEAAVEPLRRIREHNPLLFDLVLKRQLRDGSSRLGASVFDTRRHFKTRSATFAAGRDRRETL